MFKKSILALAVLGGVAASASAVFAADETHAPTVHRHHKAAVHQVEPRQVVQNRPLSWSLPQGWPHTP